MSVHDSSSSSNSAGSGRTGHLLALYPSPSDPTLTVPFTFVNISSASASYTKTGKAFVPLKLLNFRSPGFVLRLVSNGTFYPVILAESSVITNTIINSPGQVHLAQHADGQSVVVQWVSGSSSPQQLHYSTKAWTSQNTSSSGSKARNDFVRSVVSISLTYSQDMMCGEPANSFGFMHPGFLHTAVIPAGDVGHGRKLYYRCVHVGAIWHVCYIVCIHGRKQYYRCVRVGATWRVRHICTVSPRSTMQQGGPNVKSRTCWAVALEAELAAGGGCALRLAAVTCASDTSQHDWAHQSRCPQSFVPL